MGRLETITNALSRLSPYKFQALCDEFLLLENPNDKSFTRTGSQKGKENTVKGTPDTYAVGANEKYIFVEYSTNVSLRVKKLKDDIEKCLDESKTGIPIQKIEKIIVCTNFSFKDVKDDDELRDWVKNRANTLNIPNLNFQIYGLDDLATRLNQGYPMLVSEYLGLTFDTGQIVTVKQFISEYGKKTQSMATPLDNTFLPRDNDFNQLNNLLAAEDFIILTGGAGVGKTRLSLEVMNKFSSEYDYTAFCLSNKHTEILQDLQTHLAKHQNYILFIDDANRIDLLKQIIAFYSTERIGKLKILMTVRDYALQDVKKECLGLKMKELRLEKLSDDDIISIVKAEPLQILNPKYHDKIVDIAQGNPRIAIMLACLAKETNDISTLYDVSNVFDKYFSTFVNDKGELEKEISIKCLGLIAFFNAIHFNNKDVVEPMLNLFGINYSDFHETIKALEKLELVDVNFEWVKIGEQNLANYFFYRAFIKDKVLSFDTLLTNYFDYPQTFGINTQARFRDCIVPVANIFGIDKLANAIEPVIRKYLKNIPTIKLKFDFFTLFYFILIEDCLSFLLEIIENDTTDNIDIIELLNTLLRGPDNLKDVLALGFEYVKKKSDYLDEWLDKIKEQFTFKYDDERYIPFSRQNALFQMLIDGLKQDDETLIKSFYQLSPYFLGFTFNNSGLVGRNRISMSYYSLKNSIEIQEFRQSIWNAIDDFFAKYPEASFKILLNYLNTSPIMENEQSVANLMQFDINCIIKIIEKYLVAVSFSHCRYVADLIEKCERNKVQHAKFTDLLASFTNPTYELFLQLSFRYLDGKLQHSYTHPIEKQKEQELRKKLVFEDIGSAEVFCERLLYLKKNHISDWTTHSIYFAYPYVIDENFLQNFEIGCALLEKIIEQNNELDFTNLSQIFKNQLNKKEHADKIWKIIRKKSFNFREQWELAFYADLDEALLSKKYVSLMKGTFRKLKNCHLSQMHFVAIKQFSKTEPNLIKDIFQIIVKNNDKNACISIYSGCFVNCFDDLAADINPLKKAYLQQSDLIGHWDIHNIFQKILEKSPEFLLEYITHLYKAKQKGSSNNYSNSLSSLRIWEMPNIESTLRAVFDVIAENETYFSPSSRNKHFITSFFMNLEAPAQQKAKNFIWDYCKNNASNLERMNLLITTIRHTNFSEFFEEFVLDFLKLNQDKEFFAGLQWWDTSMIASAGTIFADIEIESWRNLQKIVDKSALGIKLFPIKKYIADQMNYYKERSEEEHRDNFLRGW